MKNISSPKTCILQRALKPKKSFGQNFMVDQRINSIFAQAVGSIGKNLPIIEIGAGTGSLTAHLLDISSILHAIERDRDLIPILYEQFPSEINEKRLVIHETDGARLDFSTILSDGEKAVLVGNLPYHLTSSIIILAQKNLSKLVGAVFLLQKEVAERLAASPNSKQYGFLTVILRLSFEIEKVSYVDKNSFWPIPKIDSCIIKMRVCDQGIGEIKDINSFMVFVREIFQKRRKKMSTIFKNQMTKDDFLHLNIDPNARPENLCPKQFLAMFLHKTATDTCPSL
jgi:16S rRNA (adenine1518-N6/adenine1519-N6)-dimethyltransferase